MPKQAEAKRDGVINPQNYNFNPFKQNYLHSFPNKESFKICIAALWRCGKKNVCVYCHMLKHVRSLGQSDIYFLFYFYFKNKMM